MNTSIHENIRQKLDNFYRKRRIPHIIFHGSSGTGKRTLIYEFINKIYEGDKQKLKTNVMFVNCAHGKGIKFIRDELKFFAKTNIQSTQGVLFKTIVLFNADSLTIDAQSALRRCIELFSYNTRFFIVVENKHKLLNPILSRFCEIYIPEQFDANGKIRNLHQMQLDRIYGPDNNRHRMEWLSSRLGGGSKTYAEWVDLVTEAYERGISCLDVIEWIKCSNLPEKHEMVMRFQNRKAEFRCEKMLMLVTLAGKL